MFGGRGGIARVPFGMRVAFVFALPRAGVAAAVAGALVVARMRMRS